MVLELEPAIQKLSKMPLDFQERAKNYIDILYHSYIDKKPITEIEVIIDTEGNVQLDDRCIKELLPGKYRLSFTVLEESFEISEDLKLELDKRLDRIKNDPKPGYSLTDILQEVEKELGRKIPNCSCLAP